MNIAFRVQVERDDAVLNFAADEYVRHAAWAQEDSKHRPSSQAWIGTWAALQADYPELLHEDELSMMNSSYGDAFLICERDDRLILSGRSERAALYAVYQYAADRWGMHWIYPGEKPVRSSPKLDRASFELYSPSMERRGFVFETVDDAVYMKSMVDWLAKNKVNEIFFTFMLWDAIGGELAEDIQRRGLNVTLGGHSMKFLMKGESAEVGAADHPYTAKKQLIYSDLSWQGELLDKIAEYSQAVPNLTRLSLWPEDIAVQGVDGFLRDYIGFTERLRERLTQANSNVEVEHIAYNAGLSWHMLERGELFPSSTADTLFAYWGRDYRYPLDHNSNDSDERACQALQDWIRAVHENGRQISVFEYYSDHFMLTPLFPMLPARIAEDVAYYRGLGVDGMTNLVVPVRNMDDYPWQWNHGFNSYVFCRSLWGDPIQEILEDYYAYYSESERQAVMALHRTIEELATELTSWNVPLFPARAVDPARARAAPEQAKAVIGLLRKLQAEVKSQLEAAQLHPQDEPSRCATYLITYAKQIEEQWLQQLLKSTYAYTMPRP